MDKPKRHNSHILETESRKFFNNQVPDAWIIDKPDHDYGIDFNVGIVIKNQVTGLNFSVQLKSTKNSNKRDYTSIILKHSTLRMFNTRLEPVFLINYIQKEKEAYWYWYNDLSIDLTSVQKTYSIRIPKKNILSAIDWDEITKYVQNIFSIKTLADSIKSLEYKEISNSEILAWRYYYSGDFENAVFYFKNLLREKPNNHILLEGLAHSQYMSFNYKEALYNINKAIELSGRSNQYLTKACILAEDGIQNNIKGKVIEAKNIFKRFIEEFPNQEIYHYNFGNTLSRLGETDEAIKHYKICLMLNPNNAKAWKNLAQVYYELRQHDEELKCYDKALSIDPNLSQALFSKGITLSHIYEQHEKGLTLMMKSLEVDKNLLINFPRGYYWIAYVHEKLNNINESLKWINIGLEHNPEDRFFLNFKSILLSTHWEDNDHTKQEAIYFYKYRLELENDYQSLYYLILLQDIKDEMTILDLIKKHTKLLQSSTIATLKKCRISISDSSIFLLHYDKYLYLRHLQPINRYLEHLISKYYSISSEFWEVLDLIFSVAYSSAFTEYFNRKNEKEMFQKVLLGLEDAPNSIFELIPDEAFKQEDAISIMSHLYLEFPTVILREFGVQIGDIAGRLKLKRPDPEEYLSEDWFDKLHDLVLYRTNEKLKLLKEE